MRSRVPLSSSYIGVAVEIGKPRPVKKFRAVVMRQTAWKAAQVSASVEDEAMAISL